MCKVVQDPNSKSGDNFCDKLKRYERDDCKVKSVWNWNVPKVTLVSYLSWEKISWLICIVRENIFRLCCTNGLIKLNLLPLCLKL